MKAKSNGIKTVAFCLVWNYYCPRLYYSKFNIDFFRLALTFVKIIYTINFTRL